MAVEEIRTRLVVEDATTDPLNEIADAFEGTDAAAEHAKGGLREFAKGFRDIYEGGRYAVEMVKGFSEFLTGAAAEGQVADTSLATLMSTVQGIPWQAAMEGAQKLGDELDDLGRRTGVATGDIEAGFHALVEVAGATADGVATARAEAEALATISGAMGTSVEGAAREIAFMGEGMLKTKGSMFQLLQSTGVFGSDIKKAKEEWAALSEESRMAKLEEGIAKVAKKAAEMPATFAQTKTSLADVIEMAREKIGEPLIEAITPVLKDLADFIADHLPQMVELAKDFASILHPLFTFMKAVLVYWVANKASMVVMNAASGVAGMAGGAIGTAFQAAGGGLGGALSGGAAMLGPQGAMGLLAVSAYALTEAIGALKDSLDNTKDSIATQKAMEESLATASKMGSRALFDQIQAMEKQTNELHRLGQMRAEEAIHMDKTIAQYRVQLRQMQELDQASAKAARIEREQQFAGMADAKKKLEFALKNLDAAINDKSWDTAASVQNASETWVTAFNFATKTHDAASQQYLLGILAQSQNLQQGLLKSGLEIEGGLASFADAIQQAGASFVNQISPDIFKAASGHGKVLPSGSMFGGPTTINVKQEFRNEDPDRIAVVFQRDLQRAAERRYQATTGTPFGT